MMSCFGGCLIPEKVIRHQTPKTKPKGRVLIPLVLRGQLYANEIYGPSNSEKCRKKFLYKMAKNELSFLTQLILKDLAPISLANINNLFICLMQ